MMGALKSLKLLDEGPARIAALVALGTLVVPKVASAQTGAWAGPTWYQALGVPLPTAVVPGVVPSTIPGSEELADPTGLIGTYRVGGPLSTAGDPFFTAPPNSNGRTCFSCHQPQDGWAIRPSSVLATFLATRGRDPVFAPVDGADCPDLVRDEDDDDRDHVCSAHGFGDDAARFRAARKQLFSKANFRIFLPIPRDREWTVRIVSDPYGCETSPTYGEPAGFLSVYRRPLPSANTHFLAPGGRKDQDGNPIFNIMWDAREPELPGQFVNATLIHAQAALSQAELDHLTNVSALQGRDLQNSLFTAQVYDDGAGRLDGPGVNGGPAFLSTLGPGSRAAPGATVFDLFGPFASATGASSQQIAARRSIARGRDIFNGVSKTFTIADVSGFNDIVRANPRPGGSCSNCHNNVDRGNDFFLDPKRLSIGDNSNADGLAPSPDLPLFSFRCPKGSIQFFKPQVAHGHQHDDDHDELLTTDPGLGLITGKCDDLGKMKVPVLRGLAARAPYFHGGDAATLDDLVKFYDRRFSIGFTPQEKHDLVNFLNSL
jgi:hypothetical protein